MNRGRWIACALCAWLAPGGRLAGELAENQVRVEVRRAPAEAAVRTLVRVERLAAEVQRLDVHLTNSSDREISLDEVVVRVPWRLPADDALICAGGFDQGRPGARIHPARGSAVESGAFLLARRTGGFSFAGLVTCRVFNSKLRFADGAITISADGEGRRVRAGETVALESVRLAEGTDWQDLMFDFAGEIAREARVRLNRPKTHTGWATWDYYGGGWSFEAVTRNLERLVEIYPAADLLQLDGGWWPLRGDYTTWRESLGAGGVKELARLIRAKGLTAGLHLDAMRADTDARIVREHPEFFLKDERGEILADGRRAFFDYSHPGTREHMRRVLATMRRDWGFDYFKLDFLRFGLTELIRPLVVRADGTPRAIVPFDRSRTSVERLHLGLAALRDGMGADAFLLGCSALYGPTFGHVDGLRTGDDVHPNFERLKHVALQNAGNFHLHARVVHNDADYHVVRAREDQDGTMTKSKNKIGTLTLNEAEMWTHYVGLFGGTKLNSDNLPTLRAERRALFVRAASLPTADRFVPIDLWQHARAADDPPAVMLGEATGVVHLGVFNWRDAPRRIRLRGLAPEERQGVTRLHGTGDVTTEGAAVVVGLPPRHSLVLRLDHASFDRLRKALTVEGETQQIR
jgi:alpha-galactosidase